MVKMDMLSLIFSTFAETREAAKPRFPWDDGYKFATRVPLDLNVSGPISIVDGSLPTYKRRIVVPLSSAGAGSSPSNMSSAALSPLRMAEFRESV